MNSQNKHPVGLTKDAGYQFGIRRTVSLSPSAAWDFLLSPRGLRMWLGILETIPTEIGSEFVTAEGVRGRIRAGKPGSHIRMDWQPAGEQTASILQIRVLPAGEKATISVHLERLTDENHRNEMSRHWSEVINRMIEQLSYS